MQKDRMLWESTQDRQHSQKYIYMEFLRKNKDGA